MEANLGKDTQHIQNTDWLWKNPAWTDEAAEDISTNFSEWEPEYSQQTARQLPSFVPIWWYDVIAEEDDQRWDLFMNQLWTKN